MTTGTIDGYVPVRQGRGSGARNGAMINLRHILLGLLSLMIGTLVYLVDRPPDQTFFLQVLPVSISLYRVYPPLFGPLGDVLPDFLHVVAFILLTAGILNCGRRWYPLVCLFWLAVDGGFELGQKYSVQAAGLVPDWFDGVFLLEKTRDYFMHGVYSNHDMIAIVIGAVVAYLILLSGQDKRRTS
ncbi:MAG: hypothetical protein AB1724_13230 [Thermodesulfobacteriota bacterium]